MALAAPDGVDGFILIVLDLRREGYSSPRASAAAFRRSVSALVGRPRFRGGSPSFPGTASLPGDMGPGEPLSLLNCPALRGGLGWIARGV